MVCIRDSPSRPSPPAAQTPAQHASRPDGLQAWRLSACRRLRRKRHGVPVDLSDARSQCISTSGADACGSCHRPPRPAIHSILKKRRLALTLQTPPSISKRYAPTRTNGPASAFARPFLFFVCSSMRGDCGLRPQTPQKPDCVECGRKFKNMAGRPKLTTNVLNICCLHKV